MTNILITGSNGQLGSEIKDLIQNSKFKIAPSGNALQNYNFHFTDRNTLDITDKNTIQNFCSKNNIGVIIDCAAYTAVDKAEEDEVNADAINHLAVKYMAEIAKEKNIKLIHISTDYVFDGQNYRPYTEENKTNPQGVYGKTKLLGEEAIKAIDPEGAIIIRTSWVYSSFGANFVKTMLRLGKERDELGVIFDQVGTPTYARDLAEAILTIIGTDALASAKEVEIYHYSNEGVASWYDFAKAIFELSDIECKVNPIETKEYLALNADTPVAKAKEGCPAPAKRPHYSLLNKSKIKNDYKINISHWRSALERCLRHINKHQF